MCVMMLRALFRILWVVFTISGDLYELDDDDFSFIFFDGTSFSWYSCYSYLTVVFLFLVYVFI